MKKLEQKKRVQHFYQRFKLNVTPVKKNKKIKSGVAQSAERVAVNHWVRSSNPSAGANENNRLRKVIIVEPLHC